MKRVGHPFLFMTILCLLCSFRSAGQDAAVRDSLEKEFGIILCDTTYELADSVMSALRTKKFKSLTPYVANAPFLKMSLDSMDTTSLLKMAQVRYNYNLNVIRKDYVKLQKTAKRQPVNFRHVEYVDKVIRIHPREVGFHYAEIFLIVKKGDKKYTISFLAVGIMGYWFIHDQLQLELMF